MQNLKVTQEAKQIKIIQYFLAQTVQDETLSMWKNESPGLCIHFVNSFYTETFLPEKLVQKSFSIRSLRIIVSVKISFNYFLT